MPKFRHLASSDISWLLKPPRDDFQAISDVLPDKEFRYLRTVIVTAAVHQGFILARERLHLTFWHWAGVSPYTSTCVLAETCVFDKQLQGIFRCDRFWVLDSGFWILDSGFWILDFGFWILDKNLVSSFQFPVSSFQLPASSILHPKSRTGSPYPEVTDAVLPSSLSSVISNV